MSHVANDNIILSPPVFSKTAGGVPALSFTDYLLKRARELLLSIGSLGSSKENNKTILCLGD